MRIDSVFQGQYINLSNISAILDKANVGDIIRAQILEIASNELMLKLFDGSTVNAATTESTDNIEAKKGEFADFRVKEKNGSKVLLEPVKNPNIIKADAGTELTKQLKALGISTDNESLEIARELKSNNIPLNKENFERIVDIVSKFNGANPSKAAFLIANKLGIEEKNISALKQLVDEKVKVSQSLDKLISSIDGIQDETLLKSISEKLSSINPNKTYHCGSENINLSVQATKQAASSSKGDLLMKEIDKILSTAFENMNRNVDQKGPSSIDDNTLDKIKAFFEYNKNSSENIGEKFTNFLSRNLNNQGNAANNSTLDLPDFVNGIISKIKDFENGKESAFLVRQEHNNNEKPNTIFKFDDVKKEIRNMFDKLHVNIHSDNLKEDLNVKNLYKELYSKLEVIRETVEASTIANKTDILSNIDQMENNIRFMNQLNNYNTYLQIPLNIWNRNTTGELYVLKKDGRRKKIDPDNSTMLISLNTENLGQVDTIIGISKKNINVSMRVEDNNIIEFIKGYHKELYERLQDKGYKLVDLKFRIPDEDVNIENIGDIVEKDHEYGKVSLDYRV